MRVASFEESKVNSKVIKFLKDDVTKNAHIIRSYITPVFVELKFTCSANYIGNITQFFKEFESADPKRIIWGLIALGEDLDSIEYYGEPMSLGMGLKFKDIDTMFDVGVPSQQPPLELFIDNLRNTYVDLLSYCTLHSKTHPAIKKSCKRVEHLLKDNMNQLEMMKEDDDEDEEKADARYAKQEAEEKFIVDELSKQLDRIL